MFVVLKNKEVTIYDVNSKCEIQVVKNDTFTTKRAYADALRGNGYRVRFIAKPEEFDEVCENFYSRKK